MEEFVNGGATFGKGGVGFGFMARTILRHLLVLGRLWDLFCYYYYYYSPRAYCT